MMHQRQFGSAELQHKPPSGSNNPNGLQADLGRYIKLLATAKKIRTCCHGCIVHWLLAMSRPRRIAVKSPSVVKQT
jgi:hypothetical protein